MCLINGWEGEELSHFRRGLEVGMRFGWVFVEGESSFASSEGSWIVTPLRRGWDLRSRLSGS